MLSTIYSIHVFCRRINRNTFFPQRQFGGDILRVIYPGLLHVLCSSQILCINNIAIFPEIILFDIKNATKEHNILPLISTIKTASLFFEYLNIPRTSKTTHQTSILPSMPQVGEYVYLWTHVRASSYTFGVFCVWIFLVYAKLCFQASIPCNYYPRKLILCRQVTKVR